MNDLVKLTTTGTTEGDADPRAGRGRLGYAVLEPLLDRPTHHEQVARCQSPCQRGPATSWANSERTGGTCRDEGHVIVEAARTMAVTVPGHTVSAIAIEIGPGGYVGPVVVVREGIGHRAQGSRRLADAGRESGFYNLVVDYPPTMTTPGKAFEEVEEQLVSAGYPSGHMVNLAVVIQFGVSNGGLEE